MSLTSHRADVYDDLQDGISCARATLAAIDGADLLESLPEESAHKERHNHGLWLLRMLREKLDQLQERVDAASAAAAQ